jgi:toxin ParE1/3/4
MPAYNDFMVYVNYYRNESGSFLSAKFADAIEKSLKNLSLMPTIARPGFKINTRQYILQEFPFIIEFRVRNNTVEILAFLHQSRKI